ncbi:hypothetical protein IscW_ISCW009135, partial [Ixodes scapularis]
VSSCFFFFVFIFVFYYRPLCAAVGIPTFTFPNPNACFFACLPYAATGLSPSLLGSCTVSFALGQKFQHARFPAF